MQKGISWFELLLRVYLGFMNSFYFCLSKATLCIFCLLSLNYENFLLCLWIRTMDVISLLTEIGWGKKKISFLQASQYGEQIPEYPRSNLWRARPCCLLTSICQSKVVIQSS